jgi:hypothetical protein
MLTEDTTAAEGMPNETRQIEVLEDGLTVDTETGEVLDVAIPSDFLDDTGLPLMTDGLCCWVMRKILRFDSEVIAAHNAVIEAAREIEVLTKRALEKLEATPEMIELRAIQTNAWKIHRQSENAGDYFRDRFRGLLASYARMRLQGTKAKSLKTPFGTIAITTFAPRLAIADEAKFIKWALKKCPEAVKQESRISKITKDLKEQLLTGDKSRLAAGLVINTPPEKVEITTGAEPPKEVA